MLRMIRFELKKMYSNSVVIGSLAVLLLVCFLILQAYCFNNSATSAITPDGTQLSGREAITFNQSIAQKYAGDFTDDTIAKMVLDFSRDYPTEYAETDESGAINSLVPTSYLYLAMFIPPANYDEIAQDAISHGTSIPPLTEDGLVSIRDYGAAYVDKPLQYGYNDSWAYFFSGFCGQTIAIAFPALIVIIIAVSTIFSSEYSSYMDVLFLSSRYGKNRLIIAKLFASMIFTTMMIGCLFILFCVAFGVQYGVLGWNADIQANLGLSLMGVNLPLNNLQLIFFALGIVWLAGIIEAAVTAMISAVTKTPFSSLIVAFAVFMAPWIIRQLLPESTLRDLLIVFPANAVNAHEVLLMPVDVQSVFYNQPLAPVLCIAFATIIMLLVSSAIAYKAFKNHQTAN